MNKLRQGFHDVLNRLNKITIKSGLLVELSKGKDIDSMDIEELRKKYKKALEILSGTEEDALEAGKGIELIKKEVFNNS